MAQEDLTVQTASRTGAEAAMQSITNADGFKFENDGKTLLYVENDAGALVLTFKIQPTMDDNAVAVKSVTVTASEKWYIGPFPTQWYNDTSDEITCTCDADLASGVALVSVG